MLRYLQDKQGRYSTAEIRRVLFRNGYLAQALREVGHDQYQVYALTLLLVAAFPKEQYPLGLDKATIIEVLARTSDPPTPALLAAILRKSPPTETSLAWDAYVYGSIARMDLNEATHGALWTHLPAIEPDPAPGPALASLEPGPATEPTVEVPPWLMPEPGPRRELEPWLEPGAQEET
jgi:hypothetical protein